MHRTHFLSETVHFPRESIVKIGNCGEMSGFDEHVECSNMLPGLVPVCAVDLVE